LDDPGPDAAPEDPIELLSGDTSGTEAIAASAADDDDDIGGGQRPAGRKQCLELKRDVVSKEAQDEVCCSGRR
jgi:hypothetical protein